MDTVIFQKGGSNKSVHGSEVKDSCRRRVLVHV